MNVVSEGVVLVPEVVLGRSAGHGEHEQHSSEPTQFQFVAIKWLDAIYLVEKNQIADFADFSAGLGDYNENYSYLLSNPFLAMGIGETEANAVAYTPPVYPRGYETFHKPPIRGSIISIGRGRKQVDADSDSYDRLVTPLKIRLERIVDPKSAIKLRAVGQDMGFIEEFELKSIDRNIATVEHSRLVVKRNCVVSTSEDCKDPDHLKLRVGMALSSNGL